MAENKKLTLRVVEVSRFATVTGYQGVKLYGQEVGGRDNEMKRALVWNDLGDKLEKAIDAQGVWPEANNPIEVALEGYWKSRDWKDGQGATRKVWEFNAKAFTVGNITEREGPRQQAGKGAELALTIESAKASTLLGKKRITVNGRTAAGEQKSAVLLGDAQEKLAAVLLAPGAETESDLVRAGKITLTLRGDASLTSDLIATNGELTAESKAAVAAAGRANATPSKTASDLVL